MVLTVEDILPMNKGTQAYTEYSLDERVIEYMMDNETMEKGWKMGHIHSHNTMSVFFSGTDWSELEDNAPNHNFYLSLIVNNFMDFCAKVCFIAEAKQTKDFDFLAKDELGQEYIYVAKPYEVKQKKLVVYDCDIKSPVSAISVGLGFKSSVDKIIKDAEAKEIALATSRARTGVGTSAGTGSTTWVHPKYGAQAGHSAATYRAVDRTPEKGKVITPDFTGWSKKEEVVKKETKVETKAELSAQDLEELITNFSMYVLLTGNELETFVDVEDICEHYAKYNIPHDHIVETIVSKYLSLYDNFFKDSVDQLDVEVFVTNTELLIDEYVYEAKMSDSDAVGGLLYKVAAGIKTIIEALN